jgi:hypothetical protein
MQDTNATESQITAELCTLCMRQSGESRVGHYEPIQGQCSSWTQSVSYILKKLEKKEKMIIKKMRI